MPVEDIQEPFSGQVDACCYEEDGHSQAENQTEFPEETNLLLLLAFWMIQRLVKADELLARTTMCVPPKKNTKPTIQITTVAPLVPPTLENARQVIQRENFKQLHLQPTIWFTHFVFPGEIK